MPTSPPVPQLTQLPSSGFWRAFAQSIEYVLNIPRSAWMAFVSAVESFDPADQYPTHLRDQLKATRDPIGSRVGAFVQNIALAAVGLLGFYNEVGRISLDRAVRDTLSFYRPNILSIAGAVNAYIQNQITEAQFWKFAERNGVPEVDARIMVDTAGEPLAAGQFFDLLNRGLISEADAKQGILESRLKPKYTDLLLKLRYNLLGASDYIRFAVREVYDPPRRAALQLDEDWEGTVGPLLTEKLRKIGYSEEDAKDSWAAHWELPSPTQVYEMLHRGLINKDDVKDYLRAADYSPVWRDKLLAISYSPLTRVDVRRAYKLGVVTLDQVKQTYKDIGYDDHNAQILTDFTKQDANTERVQERELLVAPVKAQALALYKSRRISEGQLRQTLANLKYPNETVDRFIADIEFVRESDHRDDIANAVKLSYVKALRSREDTITLLTNHGWSLEGITQLMEAWDILREATELQPHQSAQRDLTKGELLAALSDGLWSEDQVRESMLKLGYDDNETAAIIGHQKLVQARKDQQEQVDVVHEQYVSRAIDRDAASIRLDQIGVNANRKYLLLAKWSLELEKRIPDFSLSMLEQMVKKNVLSEDLLGQYLRRQNWTDEQIYLLMTLWGMRPTTAGILSKYLTAKEGRLANA